MADISWISINRIKKLKTFISNPDIMLENKLLNLNFDFIKIKIY